MARQYSARPLRSQHDFLLFWAGQSVSLVGSQVTLLALPLTAVLVLRATPLQMGLLTSVGFAPFLLLTLPVGVWVDRVRRKPLMIAADLGRAALLALIPALALLGRLRMAQLYAIAFLAGCCTVVFHLAYLAYVPSLVPADDLTGANGHLTASESSAEVGGPGLAGLLAQAFGAPLAILADAISFIISAATLWRIRMPEPSPAPGVAASPASLRCEIAEGFRLVFGHPYLRAFLGEATLYNFFWEGCMAVLYLYAVRQLNMTAGLLGLAVAVGAVGGLLGAVTTGRLARRFGLGHTILASVILSATAPLLIPLAPMGVAPLMLGVGLFLTGVGTSACNVHVITVRQSIVPAHLLGRLNASYRLISYGAIPVGALLGGICGGWIGLRATLLLGTLGLLSAALWIACTPVRRLRTLPTDLRAAHNDEPPAGDEILAETEAAVV